MSKSFISFQDKTVTWGHSTFDITDVYSPQGDDGSPFKMAVSAISNYESAASALEDQLRALIRSANTDLERLENGQGLYGIAPNTVAHVLQREQQLKDLAEQANLFFTLVPERELERRRLA